MFNKDRYLTRGVAEEVPLEIQLLIWSMIGDMKCKKDYLQVFEIKPVNSELIEIEHRQEVPKYSNTLIVKNKEVSYTIKIFVIDDGEYSTMLLASEY